MSKMIKINSLAGVSAQKRASIAAKLKNLEYRHAFVEATITQGIAYQIKTNRDARQWSQEQLGEKIGNGKKQSAISRLEDPSYGKFSIRTLLEVAKAFDVALVVKFVPFSKFIIETSAKDPKSLFVKSYESENLYLSEAQVYLCEEYISTPKMIENEIFDAFDAPILKKKQTQSLDISYITIESVNYEIA